MGHVKCTWQPAGSFLSSNSKRSLPSVLPMAAVVTSTVAATMSAGTRGTTLSCKEEHMFMSLAAGQQTAATVQGHGHLIMLSKWQYP